MYDSGVQFVGMCFDRCDEVGSQYGIGTYTGLAVYMMTESSDVPVPYVETHREKDLRVALWILTASIRPARIE